MIFSKKLGSRRILSCADMIGSRSISLPFRHTEIYPTSSPAEIGGKRTCGQTASNVTLSSGEASRLREV